MELFSKIRHIFQCDDINVSERLSTVEAEFTIAFQTLPDMETMKSICALAPTRDTFTMTFINDSDDTVILSNKQTETPNLSSMIDGLSKDDNINVRIQIDKDVSNGKFSIYDFDSFVEDLLHRSLLDVLTWFSRRLLAQEYLMFEVFDYDISLSTRIIAFESSDAVIFKPKINRNQRLRACKETAYFYNMNVLEVIPDDFIIEGVVRAGERLKPLFGKLATILSIIYSASSASIHDTTVDVQFSGQRTSIHELELTDIQEDEKWQSICSWIFTDGNSTDKALIAHNIISLYCKYETLLALDSTVFDTIKTNYNLYLRNNVNQYIEMKHDLAMFIQNIVALIGDYAIVILGKFKTNLIAIFCFIFTVGLTRIGGMQKWGDIFTRDTIYIIESFIIGSMVYLVICIFETLYKLKKTKQGYIELKNNYKDVLSDVEIKEAFKDDKLLTTTMRSVKSGMFWWSVIWGGLLVLTIIIIEFLTINHGLITWLWNKLISI